MAVNLSPVGGVAAQFFTNSGVPLTGGKIFTYAAGTTTPQASYTTSQGNVAWTNPIVLDAAGRVPGGGEIWLTDGLIYKFVLKDANDVLIATYDNITGINSNAVAYTNQQEIVTATAGQTVFNLGISYQPGTNSLSVFVDGVNQYGPGAQYSYVETNSTTVTFNAGLHVGAEVKFTTTQQQAAGAVDASQVTYDPPFTGSVATNVEDKLAQTVSVLDFGADPTGATDSTTAIQDAIDFLAPTGGMVTFPSGTYLTAGVELPTAKGVTLSGASRNSTTLSYTGAGTAIVKTDLSVATANHRIEHLCVSNAGTGSVGIDFSACWMGEIFNCYVTGFPTGIYLDRSSTGTYWNRIIANLIDNCDNGIILSATGTAGTNNQNWVRNNRIYAPTTVGIKIEATYSEGNQICENDIETVGALPRYVDCQGNFNVVANNWFDSVNAGNVGVYLSGDQNTIRENIYAGTFSASWTDSGTNTLIIEAQQGYVRFPQIAIANSINSASGVVNIPTGVATTIYTLTGLNDWGIFSVILNNNNANVFAVAYAGLSNTNAGFASIVNNACTLTRSGNNIRLTHSLGSSLDFKYAYLKLNG